MIGDHIADEIRAHGRYENEILELLDAWVLDSAPDPSAVALDIGANIGNHAIFLSHRFGSVLAFEPNPVARALLKLNIDLNDAQNVEIVSSALSDRGGTSQFRMNLPNLGSSALAEIAIADPDNALVQRHFDVELVTGDSIVAPEAKVEFIKIDVEGAEYSVLRGLRETIRRCRPTILFEQLATPIDEDTGTSDALRMLLESGYSVNELVVRKYSSVGIIHNLITLLTGKVRCRISPLNGLEKRNYPAILATPVPLDIG
ncbi:FkbM family methyltransferase [Parasphingopyxis sp. CP4]|uniref:FkbM family methyltransferase n=1 Tax=Parasphingopyxis sp. CP4 TaxID=2724527 RepID=UPI0015A14F4D|nr:FkbM family methyltransferase [Parasphingopyxis sp. CP4]QLC22457.1 FkbM family methyltransferase [Parasphingopyxis sp. CP4]